MAGNMRLVVLVPMLWALGCTYVCECPVPEQVEVECCDAAGVDLAPGAPISLAPELPDGCDPSSSFLVSDGAGSAYWSCGEVHGQVDDEFECVSGELVCDEEHNCIPLCTEWQ